MTINGAVTILTSCFTVDAGATITGVGGGFNGWTSYGDGPGAGGVTNAPPPVTCLGCPPSVLFGGGGGHGGAGATICDGSYCANGGVTNDDPVHPALMGSIGGDYEGGLLSQPGLWPNAVGGGLLKVIVYDPITNLLTPATVNGTIDMSGLAGAADYGNDAYSGGGAGGTILIESNTLFGTGLLQANGGGGPSAGGGGGIISLIENSTSFPGTISVVSGGGGSSSGTVTFTTPPLTGY